MTLFGYPIGEIQKAIVAAIFFIGYGVSLFVFVDPGLIIAIAALVPPLVGVYKVFAKANHSAGQLNKALEQLQAAATTVAIYFVAVPASTQNKITMAVGAGVSVIAVWWRANKKHPASTTPTVVPTVAAVNRG